MPKTRLDKYSADPYAPLREMIIGKLGTAPGRAERFAALIGCSSQTTARQRCRNPGTLTLDELMGIKKGLKLTDEEWRRVLP